MRCAGPLELAPARTMSPEACAPTCLAALPLRCRRRRFPHSHAAARALSPNQAPSLRVRADKQLLRSALHSADAWYSVPIDDVGAAARAGAAGATPWRAAAAVVMGAAARRRGVRGKGLLIAGRPCVGERGGGACGEARVCRARRS
uniref:Uncharacterized protein n=1 Tax=Emiliania huxleyi TaxID=2903 RepID=A0A7S3SF89_EMIHU